MRDLWECLDFSVFACEVASVSCTVTTVNRLNHFLWFGRKSTTILSGGWCSWARTCRFARHPVVCGLSHWVKMTDTFRLDSLKNNNTTTQRATVGLCVMLEQLLCCHTAPANNVNMRVFTENNARKIGLHLMSVWYFAQCKLNNFSLPSKNYS